MATSARLLVTASLLTACALAANAFAVHFVGQERYICFWDWGWHWMRFRELSASLAQEPLQTLRSVAADFPRADYNLLPVLPLAPFGWLLGTGRLPYILAITYLFLLPAVLLFGLLAGFPRQFLRARYAVVGVPIQYHLRPTDQRVVGVLAREILSGRGIGKAFRRLPGETVLDGGVRVWIYERVRPFEQTALASLSKEFAGYYPEHQAIFAVAP